MNDIDARTIPYGRYKGRCMDDVAEEDPNYVVTMYEAIEEALSTTYVCSRTLYNQCKHRVIADQMARDLDTGDIDEA